MDKYILVFSSINVSVFLYNLLIKNGFKVEVMATPCSISAGCARSIIFDNEDYLEKIKKIATDNKITINKIYKIVKTYNQTRYILL